VTEPNLNEEVPAWVRRLSRHIGVTIFLFFVGGFLIREWHADQLAAGDLADALPVAGWDIGWGAFLLVANIAVWKVMSRRESRPAT
jgi:hypothetical protein